MFDLDHPILAGAENTDTIVLHIREHPTLNTAHKL
jgi:hypothetical protein